MKSIAFMICLLMNGLNLTVQTQNKASVKIQADCLLSELKRSLGIELIWIKSGKFKMGSPNSEKGRAGDEKQHRVTISRGFYIGKYEVTQKEWRDVMGGNPSYFKESGESAPVEDVSWNDTNKYCEKLNEQFNRFLPSGYVFRLPNRGRMGIRLPSGNFRKVCRDGGFR